MTAKCLNIIRKPKLAQKMLKIIDKNPRKSINTIVKELKVSRHSIGRTA